MTVLPTAQQGLHAIRNTTYDDAVQQPSVELAVVSSDLPDGSGLEFAARLRRDASYFGTPLLMVADDLDYRASGLEIVDDVVFEPLSARELLARVEVLLRRNAKPASLQGRFEVIGGVEVVVQIIALAHPHGALMFDDDTAFYFVNGRIVHARHSHLRGEAIVHNVIQRQTGAFRFQPNVMPETTSMSMDPLALLLKLHRHEASLSEDDIDNIPAKNTLEKTTLLSSFIGPALSQLGNLEGRLEVMGGVSKVLAILARSYSSGALSFDDTVTIHLADGFIEHVSHPRFIGETALHVVMQRRTGKFRFEPNLAAPMRTMHVHLETFLLTLAKEADEARRTKPRSNMPTINLGQDGLLVFPNFKLAYTYVEMMNNVQTFNVYEGRDSRDNNLCLVMEGRQLTLVALNSSLQDVGSGDGLQRLRVHA
ncbi:MAG: DUF4388 domain-containing protein [Deinococcota bacterium]